MTASRDPYHLNHPGFSGDSISWEIMEYGKTNNVFTGGSGAGCPDGFGASGGVSVGVMADPDETRNSSAPTSVDLFAGAGGLTLGLKSGGFRTLVANDNWTPAVETLAENFPDLEVSADDVRGLTGEQLMKSAAFEGRPTLVAGGPPCQGFTSAGARRASDDRNTLVSEFARIVVEMRPEWFAFENVEGFLTMSDGAFVTDLLDRVIEAGYVVRLRKVNVANYGVPQLRKRVIALGRLRADPGFPSPTHHAFGAPGVSTPTTAALPLCPTLGDGLEGLPAATDSDEGLLGHRPSKVSEIDLERIRRLAPGQTMRDLPPEFQHQSYARRANRRVSDGTPTERRRASEDFDWTSRPRRSPVRRSASSFTRLRIDH